MGTTHVGEAVKENGTIVGMFSMDIADAFHGGTTEFLSRVKGGDMGRN